MPSITSPPASGAIHLNPPTLRTSPIYHLTSHSSGPCTVVTTAGQIGIHPDGTIPSDPDQQIRLALRNLSLCLSAAGARVSDILKLTYYIVDYDHTNPRQRVHLLEFLGESRPPSTLVPVPKLALPGLVFEIEAIAAVPLAPVERVDVVVVGAGLSGLRTAVELSRAGLKVKVVEGRERVGGKTLSVPVSGGERGVCDVGAAWINDTNQSKVFELAGKYGLELVTQNTKGDLICDEGIGGHRRHAYGTLVPGEHDKEEIEGVIKLRDAFEEACQKIDIKNTVDSGKRLVAENIDKVNFEEWIRSQEGCTESAVNAFKVGTRAMLGVEPKEMSALFFLDYCKSGGGYLRMRSDVKDGGQYLRFAAGTQSISKGLASELPPDSILFKSPVRKIEQTGEFVRVVSARGVFEAKRVVVSVPTPLYKEIVFEPPLSEEKSALGKEAYLGDTCKVITVYDSPWWREHGLCGMTQSCHGPVAVTRDSSVDEHGQYSLTSFVVGQPAQEWMKLPAKDRKDAVLRQHRKVFSPFAEVQEPIEVIEQIWREEQWSQGCPCPVLGPGGLTKYGKVLRASEGLVHFVGTETAYEWKGYMEGAIRSGERGAAEVLEAIKS